MTSARENISGLARTKVNTLRETVSPINIRNEQSRAAKPKELSFITYVIGF